jgi:hypothetical protein
MPPQQTQGPPWGNQPPQGPPQGPPWGNQPPQGPQRPQQPSKIVTFLKNHLRGTIVIGGIILIILLVLVGVIPLGSLKHHLGVETDYGCDHPTVKDLVVEILEEQIFTDYFTAKEIARLGTQVSSIRTTSEKNKVCECSATITVNDPDTGSRETYPITYTVTKRQKEVYVEVLLS